jgi:hypothetical protein
MPGKFRVRANGTAAPAEAAPEATSGEGA